jgi:HEAT repeat protein
LEVLLQCLKDEVWYVRLQAVRALSRIDGKGCLPKLLEHTAQESSPLVQESVRDVMRRNLDDSLPAIERALDEKNHAVKMWHINALVDSNSVIKILAHTLSESDTERTRAVRIMEKLIRSGIHFGLKRTLDQFEQDSRNRILRIVAGIDAELATRIGSTPRRSFKYGHAYS